MINCQAMWLLFIRGLIGGVENISVSSDVCVTLKPDSKADYFVSPKPINAEMGMRHDLRAHSVPIILLHASFVALHAGLEGNIKGLNLSLKCLLSIYCESAKQLKAYAIS